MRRTLDHARICERDDARFTRYPSISQIVRTPKHLHGRPIRTTILARATAALTLAASFGIFGNCKNASAAKTPAANRIQYDAHCFTINGRDTLIYSGAFHYFRYPKELWSARLQSMKSAGLNTLATLRDRATKLSSEAGAAILAVTARIISTRNSTHAIDPPLEELLNLWSRLAEPVKQVLLAVARSNIGPVLSRRNDSSVNI